MTATKALRLAVESDLPEGWLLCTLGDITTHPQYGWTTSAEKNGHGLKLLRTTDISNGVVDWRSVPSCKEEPADPEKYLLESGDILVSRAGSVGISYLVKQAPRAVFASYLIRFRPLYPVSSDFVALFMKSPAYWSAIAEEAAGIAVPNVNASKLKRIETLLPPLPEQKRIVEKVEQLLARVNAARERLTHVPTILKQFRQAVLAAACSGRLTVDWRGSHPDAAISPALLPTESKGRKNRRAGRLWGAGVVPELTEDERSSLPDNWTWVKVQDVGRDRDDTVQVGPMSMRSKDFAVSGVPVLNVGCVQWGRFDESKLDFMPPAIAKSFERYRIARNDILFTRSGTVGRCAVAGDRQHGYLMTFHLLRVRPDNRRCLPTFLQFVFQGAAHIRRQTEEAAIGSTRAGFNTNLLAGLDVPLPPLEEQKEIVRRVEALFKLADAIEKRVAAATARAEKLTQAILAKAFRGELVPTEAELARREGRSYEPASVLLARIRGTSPLEATHNGQTSGSKTQAYRARRRNRS
jgi:type I restriction enzyme, S subunit